MFYTILQLIILVANFIGLSKPPVHYAHSEMEAFGESENVCEGHIYMIQQEGKDTVFKIEFTKLDSDGKYFLHVHNNQKSENGCLAGDFYNPFEQELDESNKHPGDLGQIAADSEGKVKVNLVDAKTMLYG